MRLRASKAQVFMHFTFQCPVYTWPFYSQNPPVMRGDMLSWLGFSLGTAVQSVSNYFSDEAFTSGSQVH